MDLRCLGVLTYEMVIIFYLSIKLFVFLKIIDKSPFHSQTPHEPIRMIRSIELTFPVGASSDLRDLITKVNQLKKIVFSL